MPLAFFNPQNVTRLQAPRPAAVVVLVSDSANPFFAKVIPAIEQRLAAAGLSTLVGNTSQDCAREERLLKTLKEFPPRGALICPSSSPRGARPALLNLGRLLPAVAFARPVDGLDYVGVDYARGAELAVEEFYQIGYRKIAFVGGNPDVPTGQERLGGYQQALARRELPVDPSWVVACAPSRTGGNCSLQALLQLKDPPTAAVCFNDLVALGVIEALERSEKKPSTKFGIIGFNDAPVPAHSRPRLTTVDTSPGQLGEAAAELLLRRIANPDLLLQTVVLQPRLIVRESCGSFL